MQMVLAMKKEIAKAPEECGCTHNESTEAAACSCGDNSKSRKKVGFWSLIVFTLMGMFLGCAVDMIVFGAGFFSFGIGYFGGLIFGIVAWLFSGFSSARYC